MRRRAPGVRLAASGRLLAFGAAFASSGCGVDGREVVVAPLQPDAAVSQPCGPQCPEVLCPSDDACKDYSDLLAQGSCGPGGACASAADCSFTWKPAARAGAACACDAAGCKLLPGEACTRSDVCASDSCVATDVGENLCCAAVCGPSEVCAPDGSSCVAATPCSEDQRRCSGAVYQHCSRGVWETLTDCGALGCSNEREGCLRSAGQACDTPADCGEGACLATAVGNRVCCTGACDASCRRCAASGTACEDIDDDEACGTIECPTDVCRSYDPPSVTTNRCVAGQCTTPAEACTVFEPQKADLECSPTALCDDQGNCSRPKKDLLAACSSGSECASGACVAATNGGSVCCAEACAATEICSATGGCVPAPVCDNDTSQCSGSSFQRCNGGQWRTLLECGTLGCSVERDGCLGGAGATCASDADCGAGRCQPMSSGASVCCTAACDGACRRCAPSGTTCENLPDDAACGVIACPPDSTCRNFPPSVSAERCVDGRCGSAGQLCVGAPRAIGQECSATNLCDGSGNCSVPKKGFGVSCGSRVECASGNCVDGVCCNTACDGICSTCAGTGGICEAPDEDPACRSRLCASPGVCQDPTVACGAQTCAANAQLNDESGPPPINGNVCCSGSDANGALRQSCESNTNSCPLPSRSTVSCDEHTDCEQGLVCCVFGVNVADWVSCKRPGPTPGFDETELDFQSCAPLNPMLLGGQLCRSPRGEFPCPAFETCSFTRPWLPGFTFCR